jgi:hypothetical protein
MAKISMSDRTALENFLGMGSGYVLNFSDRTFAEFFQSEVNIEIYQDKYRRASGSKANYMRGFWETESPKIVGELIKKLVQYWRDTTKDQSNDDLDLASKCESVAKKLLESAGNEQRTINPKLILTNDYIQQAIEKANERIKNKDYDGAITAAKTLVEEVMIEVYKTSTPSSEYKYNEDMVKLYKLVCVSLSLSSTKDMDERLRMILSGLASITNGLAALRNAAGDAHAKRYTPAPHHAQLAVNSAFTLCQFLCDTYLYQLRGKQ